MLTLVVEPRLTWNGWWPSGVSRWIVNGLWKVKFDVIQDCENIKNE